MAPSMATPSQKRKSCGRCRKLSTVLREEHRQAEAQDEPANDEERDGARLVVEEPPATTTGSDGDDAGREPGDEPAQERNDAASSPMGVGFHSAVRHTVLLELPPTPKLAGSSDQRLVALQTTACPPEAADCRAVINVELDLSRKRNRSRSVPSVYLRDTLRGTTKPNRVTWLLWAVAPLAGCSGRASARAWVCGPSRPS